MLKRSKHFGVCGHEGFDENPTRYRCLPKPHLILVVDDCEQLCRAVCRAFQQIGYAAMQATNGHEALQRFRQEEPDAIVLDLVMPGMKGGDVLREIRKVNSTIPVIIFSSWILQSDIVKPWMAAGATRFCFKLDGKAMVFLVAEILQSRDSK